MTGALNVRLSEQEGKRLFLPFLLNDEMQVAEWRPSDPVVEAPFGGVEPRYRRPATLEGIDLILVPGSRSIEPGVGSERVLGSTDRCSRDSPSARPASAWRSGVRSSLPCRRNPAIRGFTGS